MDAEDLYAAIMGSKHLVNVRVIRAKIGEHVISYAPTKPHPNEIRIAYDKGFELWAHPDMDPAATGDFAARGILEALGNPDTSTPRNFIVLLKLYQNEDRPDHWLVKFGGAHEVSPKVAA